MKKIHYIKSSSFSLDIFNQPTFHWLSLLLKVCMHVGGIPVVARASTYLPLDSHVVPTIENKLANFPAAAAFPRETSFLLLGVLHAAHSFWSAEMPQVKKMCSSCFSRVASWPIQHQHLTHVTLTFTLLKMTIIGFKNRNEAEVKGQLKHHFLF